MIKSIDMTKDNVLMDKNFLLQSPIEILPDNVEKGVQQVKVGNITLRASKVTYMENGIEKSFCELPYSKYDRRFFYFLLKLIKSNKSKRIYKFTKYSLVKEISSSQKISTSLYDGLVKTLLRWYSVDMQIDDYMSWDEKIKTVKKCDSEMFRLISGIRFYKDNQIEFEISSFFTRFINNQKYLKNINYKELNSLTNKGSGLAFQLYLYFEAWIGKTIIRPIDNLQEKLGVLKFYENKTASIFVRDVVRNCHYITKNTKIEIICEPMKEKISSGKPTYTKFQFIISKKVINDKEIETIRNKFKEKLDFQVYNYFSKSLDMIIDVKLIKNYPEEKLINLLNYSIENEVKKGTYDNPKGSGFIENPVGYVISQMQNK